RPAGDSQGRNGLNVVGRVVEQGRGRQRREAACLGNTLTLLVLLDQHEGVPESQGATMDRILLGVQTVPLEELPLREILVRQLAVVLVVARTEAIDGSSLGNGIDWHLDKVRDGLLGQVPKLAVSIVWRVGNSVLAP